MSDRSISDRGLDHEGTIVRDGALDRVPAAFAPVVAFTLVMPRWGGWTSDLGQAAQLFISYYPDRAEQMRLAAAVGRTPSADPAVLGLLVDDLGSWLAAEYTAVLGVKAPR
jgi:hypothetical protein